MGLGLIIAGAVFLFNPVICIYDILPDFIGYYLIFRGLRKIEIAYPFAEGVRRMFFWLTWLGGVKFILSVLLYIGTRGAADDDASALVVTMVFFIAEAILAMPAMSRLITKLSDIVLRTGADVKNKVKGLCIFTSVFFIIRGFFPVIPEFFTLSSYEISIMKDYFRKVYRDVFTVFSVAAVLIVGIVWLVCFTRYIRRLMRNRGFCTELERKFETELSDNPGLLIKRVILGAMSVITAGLALNIDFYAALNDRSMLVESSGYVISSIKDWGMVNLIPDILCAGIILCALLMMRKHITKKAAVFVSSGLYLLSCVYSYYDELVFNSKFVMEDIGYRSQADLLYRNVVISNAVKDALFILLMLLLTREISSIIKRHAGEILSLSADVNAKSLRLKRLHESLTKKMWVSFGFGAASAAVSLFCVANMPYVKLFWMLDILVTAVFCIVNAAVFSEIKKEIAVRYDNLPPAHPEEKAVYSE
ncbi:MAG: hypothetical protein J5933_03960 [Clostridia bacterium]|nr:hypothetical protein [Clostridia bacterium]